MSVEDRAQELELKHWELNNQTRTERRLFAPGDIGYGPAECSRCDDDMPAQRRSYGFTLCVECKTEDERRDRLCG